MTDHQEEQKNELEALESIYPEELEVLETTPYAVFEITLASQKHEDETDEESVSCTMKFGYTAIYPDEPPEMEITDSDNLEEDELTDLINHMQTLAEENLGMAMVFTMVSAIQEKLSCCIDERKKQRKAAEERRVREEEELERKKFEGTRVTIESFLAWKTKFEAEMAELRKRKAESDILKNRLSGKELFMRDESMLDSDVQFLQAEGENVEVDESLFQDMDDLDLAEDVEVED
ncbi:RWD domain-containing protein 1-like [Dreissena polymorpha]|uniref:RWD domain-containing protein n=1 Tax=Dreissena polymorpha TaxID=45954 RepID=A0A9D4CN51_DREPO|nr:RWD domain-containing protein 1-like [Dreissena polymorpha]KAH3727403.1 hypothetical protein DPMN_053337 [Dreissena polymorpha]